MFKRDTNSVRNPQKELSGEFLSREEGEGKLVKVHGDFSKDFIALRLDMWLKLCYINIVLVSAEDFLAQEAIVNDERSSDVL